jgi:hypothetical protein
MDGIVARKLPAERRSVKIGTWVPLPKDPLVWCLNTARDNLRSPHCWSKTGHRPGRCPLQAIAYSVDNLAVVTGFGRTYDSWLRLRLVLRLRAAVPASHRTWWLGCIIRYNADPSVSHADMLAWFDRAIAA